MKKRFLIPAIVGSFFCLGTIGSAIGQKDLANCNSGELESCDKVLVGAQYQITNKEWLADKAAAAKQLADDQKARNERLAKRRAETKARNERLAAEREARGEWNYDTYTDNATGKDAKRAYVTSKNSMNFGFPYSGTQYGQFIVRNHPRYGVDAYLKIKQGQLLCNSYSNTTVMVRFDNGPATRYGCTGAADHSSDIVFIQNVGGLEAGMKTAKKMYVTVSVYQEGSRTWEFNVRNYDRSKV